VHTLPNLITALRLLLVPAVVVALARGQFGLATALFVVAGISDGIDGWLARRFGWSSPVGAMLDAVADKLLIVATVVALVMLGRLPLWLTLLLLLRDTLMLVGISLYHRILGGVEIAPLFLGKLHVLVLFGVLALTLARAAGVPGLEAVLPSLFILAAVTAVSSFLRYLQQGMQRLRAARQKSPRGAGVG
jgi:cardiolipin synthase